MVKPYKILFFILAVLAILATISFFFPKNGIKINDYLSLNFPNINDIKLINEKDSLVDISKIINVETDENDEIKDTNTVSVNNLDDSVRVLHQKDSIKNEENNTVDLEFGEGAKILLYNFFDYISRSKKTSHIIHYGDSQIEGDRITAYFRNKLHKTYGGTGFGLTSAKRLDISFTINQKNSGDWKRYTIFGRIDTTVKHRNYGAMGIISRYAPPDAYKQDKIYEASIDFTQTRASYFADRYFSKIRMFYGNLKKPVLSELYVNGKLKSFKKLNTGKAVKTVTWNVKPNSKNVKIKFSGSDSPDIYGISFEGRGLTVDNIAMRGASGTDFTKINYNNFKQMFDKMNVRMVILEFGGNIVPYVKSEKGLRNYARAFRRQLKRFKSLNPLMPIIVIGPADMSTRIKGKFTSYPYLEEVINTMKEVTLSEGYIFWNMYKAMGGKNSMVAWVRAKPPLAAKDYIHFLPNGAKIMAEKFYEAIIKVQNEYNYMKENNIEFNL